MVGLSHQYTPFDKHSLGCKKFHAQQYFDGFFVVYLWYELEHSLMCYLVYCVQICRHIEKLVSLLSESSS